MKTRTLILKNLIRTVFGLFVFSIGVALEMQSNIGMAPWETLSVGISKHLPFSFGTVHVTISLAIVLIDLLMKEKIGWGTVLDALLVGNFTDLILKTGLIPLQAHIWSGVLVLVAGMTLMAVGQYFYMGAGLGFGPRDTLMVGLGKRFTKIPIGVVQTVILVAVFTIGWLLGAPVGIGTLIAVFGIGTVMQVVFQILHFEPRDITQTGFVEAIRILLKGE